MKINMNSWHYRLIENVLDGDPSGSLCVYFWQVVFRLVLVGVFGAAIWSFFGMIALATATKIGWVVVATTPLWIKACVMVFGAFVSLAFFVAGVSLVVLTVFGIVKGFTTMRELFEQWEEKQPEKEDGVFVAYIKAKKRKICPVLTFTSGDK